LGSNPTLNLAEKPREMGTKLGCKAAITLNSKVLLRRSRKHRKEKILYWRILKTWVVSERDTLPAPRQRRDTRGRKGTLL